MSDVRKRRWLKLSLMALGVVVFLFLAWLDSRSKWISERDQMRTWVWAHAGFMEDESSKPPVPQPAPWSIRMCGEKGVSSIILDEKKIVEGIRYAPERDPKLMAKNLRRLFPEATIRYRDLQGRETGISAD